MVLITTLSPNNTQTSSNHKKSFFPACCCCCWHNVFTSIRESCLYSCMTTVNWNQISFTQKLWTQRCSTHPLAHKIGSQLRFVDAADPFPQLSVCVFAASYFRCVLFFTMYNSPLYQNSTSKDNCRICGFSHVPKLYSVSANLVNYLVSWVTLTTQLSVWAARGRSCFPLQEPRASLGTQSSFPGVLWCNLEGFAFFEHVAFLKHRFITTHILPVFQ